VLLYAHLRDWPLWNVFVDDFHSKLFRQSGVRRESLRSDPDLLKPFFEWISRERERRLFTHATMGEVDLLESAAKVKRRQTTWQRRLHDWSTIPATFGWRESFRRYFQNWWGCDRCRDFWRKISITLIDRKASLHRGTLRNAFTANTSLV